MKSERPTRNTGVNDFMLVFIFLFFGSIVACTLFGPQGDPVTSHHRDMAVAENLRMLVVGAEKYFLAHPKVNSVRTSNLVGTNSSQYIKPFATVAGESYTATILRGQPVTASGIAGARTVTYAP